MSTAVYSQTEFTKGESYARENLLGKVFKLDLDVARDLIDSIEGKDYGTPSFEAGVRSYCHKLLGQLGIETMSECVETQQEFGIAGMHKKLQLAWSVAKEAHEGQVREGTDLSYFDHHLVPVARQVSEFVTMHNPSMDQVITARQVNLICAALLHDVKEDTGMSDHRLTSLFGEDVASLVEAVTKVEGDEAQTQQKLIRAEWRARLLKCFDIHHNGKDLAVKNPEKGVVWYQKKIDLIEASNGAFLEGIPPVVAESLKSVLYLGLNLSQALSAKK